MAGIYKRPPPSRPAGFKNFRAPSWNRKPPVYKRPKPLGPSNTTAGLENYTGYEGPGVQDLINQGKIGWNKGLGNIGYTARVGAAGDGPGGGGGGDNWSAPIGGDWEVQEAEAFMASQLARARGDYRADLRRAFVELGLSDTGKLGKEFAGEIDAETIKNAAANKYSLMAQIAQTAERSRAGNNAALAARGILSSGQTTKSQTDVTAGAEQNRYAGLQEFLSGATQGKRAIADLSAQLAQGVAQARAAAAARAAEWNYMYGGGGGGGGSHWSANLPGGSDFDYSGIPKNFSSGGWAPKGFNLFKGSYGKALKKAGAPKPPPKKKK